MFKFLPATEKEWDIREVEKATPIWVKILAIVFVAAIIAGALVHDAYGCTDPCGVYTEEPTAEEKAFNKNMQKRIDMANSLGQTLFGIEKIVNDMFMKGNTVYIDVTAEAVEADHYTPEGAGDYLVEHMLDDISAEQLAKIGVHSIHFLIDGVPIKVYNAKALGGGV